MLDELTRALTEHLSGDIGTTADTPPSAPTGGPSGFVSSRAADTGQPRWDWEDGWKSFSLARTDAATAVVRVAENDLVTNGHAGFALHRSRIEV